ncbi:MAG: hypothetical protein E7388_04805 [Ruminococcaceae bacterium]|nr:hypothetical protein [Oscillospiraceae bacterium]
MKKTMCLLIVISILFAFIGCGEKTVNPTATPIPQDSIDTVTEGNGSQLGGAGNKQTSAPSSSETSKPQESPEPSPTIYWSDLKPEGQNAFYGVQKKLVPTNKVVAESNIWRTNKSKNLDAFIYNDSTVNTSTPYLKMHSKAANVITTKWVEMVESYFTSGNYLKVLKKTGQTTNQTLERLDSYIKE